MAALQTIRIRRGTKAQLDALVTGGTPLLSGELGYTTDSKQVFIGDGSGHVLVGGVFMGTFDARPVAGIPGRMYYVTSGTNATSTFLDTGSEWTSVGVKDLSQLNGTIDDIADGTTFAKVKASELASGFVKQVNDGTNVATAADIRAHLDDASKHFVIDDTSTAATSVWSSAKVRSAIDTAITGLDFQADVKDVQVDSTLEPAAPVAGDRYLITDAGNMHAGFGAIAGIGNGDIVVYDGTKFVVAYDVSVQGEGALTWVQDKDYYYRWDGTSWAEFGGLAGVIAGDGLTKSGNLISVNIADLVGFGIESDGSNNFRLASSGFGKGLQGGSGTVVSIKTDAVGGAKLAKSINVSENGVAIKVDDVTIGENASGELEFKDASVTAAKIASAALGFGLVGGNGVAISVKAGNGISVTTDGVAAVADTAKGIAVTASGIAMNVSDADFAFDGVTGALTIKAIDGGTF